MHFFRLFRALYETWVFMYLYTQHTHKTLSSTHQFRLWFFCGIWTGLADNDSCNFVLKQFSEWKQYCCSIGSCSRLYQWYQLNCGPKLVIWNTMWYNKILTIHNASLSVRMGILSLNCHSKAAFKSNNCWKKVSKLASINYQLIIVNRNI